MRIRLFSYLATEQVSPSLLLQKERMPNLKDVISALSDIIISQQSDNGKHEPTATEYFALICTTLGASSQVSEHTLQLLEILEGVTLQSSAVIVRSQFKPLSAGLLRILSTIASSDDGSSSSSNRLVRISITVIGNLLQMQDTSEGVWSSLEVLQCLNTLLGFMDDTRIRIRRVSQEQLLALMGHHKRHNTLAVRSYFADFSMQVMTHCTRSDYKRSLHLLLFLEKGAALLPDSHLSRLFEVILRLQLCEQPVLTAAVFRMSDAFFQSPSYPLSSQQSQGVMDTLLDTRPQIDMESNVYRCTAMASGLVCLYKQDKVRAFMMLPKCASALVEGCETEFTQIHTAVSIALKRIMGMVITEEAIRAAIKLAESGSVRRGDDGIVASNLARFLSILESLFLLRNQGSWAYSLDAIKSLFEKLRGDNGAILLSSLLTKLSETYESVENGALSLEPSVHKILQDAVGTAVRSLGVSNFFSILHMRSFDTPHYVGMDHNKEWMLTILHANLKLMPCLLSDFGTVILSIASCCQDAVQSPDSYSLSVGQVSIIRNRILQLWSLFPGFCSYGPLDVVEFFPRLAPMLLTALKDEGPTSFPEIIPHVISGLTYLATRAREVCPLNMETPPLAALKSHSHTFLPACLMYLEQMDISDTRFNGGVQCVAAWASISPPPLVSAIAKKILQLLLSATSSSETSDAASNWLAVILAIIPHLPTDMVIMLYKTVRPLLSVNESVSAQKRAYAVLDSLLQSAHCDVLYATETPMQILAVVSDSLLNCHVSARNMRLRCIKTLLGGMSQEQLSGASGAILGEVLICQKDANKKSRDCAIDVLKLLLQRCEPNEMLVRLCSAVVGETSVMRSSGVIGICMLFLQWRDDAAIVVQAAHLFPTLCLLLQEECPELTRAVLSFIRVSVSVLPVELLLHGGGDGGGAFLHQVIQGFTSQLGSFKNKFSSRVRAIMRKLAQRLGEDALRPWVPAEDVALLDYIQRQGRRARRKRDGKVSAELDHDRIEKMLGSDSESDDGDQEDDDDDDDAGARPGKGTNISAKEDYRIASRPKAIRVKDVQETLPASLDDLLEDGGQQTLGGGSALSDVGSKRIRGVKGKMSSLAELDALRGRSAAGDLDDEDANYRVVVSATGQVTIQEKEETVRGTDMDVDGLRVRSKRALDPDGAADSAPPPQPARKQKVSEPGSEYRSKKAGGDVWKKGMLEPHAYIPLDARLLNKKNHREAVGFFGGVVKKGGVKVGAGGSKPSHVTVGNRNQRMAAKKNKKGSGK